MSQCKFLQVNGSWIRTSSVDKITTKGEELHFRSSPAETLTAVDVKDIVGDLAGKGGYTIADGVDIDDIIEVIKHFAMTVIDGSDFENMTLHDDFTGAAKRVITKENLIVEKDEYKKDDEDVDIQVSQAQHQALAEEIRGFFGQGLVAVNESPYGGVDHILAIDKTGRLAIITFDKQGLAYVQYRGEGLKRRLQDKNIVESIRKFK